MEEACQPGAYSTFCYSLVSKTTWDGAPKPQTNMYRLEEAVLAVWSCKGLHGHDDEKDGKRKENEDTHHQRYAEIEKHGTLLS